MATFNLPKDRLATSNVELRAAWSVSAHNREDGVLKYTGGKGYVCEGEIDAAKYALGLGAQAGDVVYCGTLAYRVIAKDEPQGTLTIEAPKCPAYRTSPRYTVAYRAKGEPKPAKPREPKPRVEQPVVAAEPEPRPAQPVVQPVAQPQGEPDALQTAIDAIKALAAQPKVAEPSEEVAQLRAEVAELRGRVEKMRPSFEVRINQSEPREVKGSKHKLFDSVLKKAVRRKPVYIMGPAGTGKTYMAGQVAEALGLPLYVVGSLLQAHEIFGYMDANGNYVPTAFYKAFTGGGVFVADEFDGGSEEVALKMNSIVANRKCTFPNSEQAVEAHPNFIIIATGNTAMTGPDARYVARTEMDSSSANRWVFKYADYDTDLERAEIQDDALVDFAIEIRKLLEKQSVNMDFTIRDMYTIKEEIEDGETIEEGMAASIGRKLGRMRAKQLASAMHMDNVYAVAFANMADELKQ